MAEESVTIVETEIADDKKELKIAFTDLDDDIPDEIIKIDPAAAEDEEVKPQQQQSIQPKRKPGRPVGSKSKEPGKPRAKRTPKKQPPAVEAVDTTIIGGADYAPASTDTVRIEDERLPRVLEGSRRIPQRAHDETSELLLKLLAHQANDRKNRRVDLWKSWFK